MLKGVVMEIESKSIVVMRPDGHFDRLPRRNRSYELGEEIEYAEPRRRSIDWRSPRTAGWSALAAAVVFCVVFLASFSGKMGSMQVAAYISMDINPSVEIGIDAGEQVIELNGLNVDGIQLIEKLDAYEGKLLTEVTEQLLAAADEGALAAGEAEIVIAGTVMGDAQGLINEEVIVEKVRQQVTTHIAATRPEQVEAYQVTAFTAPQEVRQEAVKNGVSAGKYTVYLTAKSSGASVTLEELKTTSVLQIAKEKPEVASLIETKQLPTKEQVLEWVAQEKAGKLGATAKQALTEKEEEKEARKQAKEEEKKQKQQEKDQEKEQKKESKAEQGNGKNEAKTNKGSGNGKQNAVSSNAKEEAKGAGGKASGVASGITSSNGNGSGNGNGNSNANGNGNGNGNGNEKGNNKDNTEKSNGSQKDSEKDEKKDNNGKKNSNDADQEADGANNKNNGKNGNNGNNGNNGKGNGGKASNEEEKQRKDDNSNDKKENDKESENERSEEKQSMQDAVRNRVLEGIKSN